jgi:hypothetical protein
MSILASFCICNRRISKNLLSIVKTRSYYVSVQRDEYFSIKYKIFKNISIFVKILTSYWSNSIYNIFIEKSQFQIKNFGDDSYFVPEAKLKHFEYTSRPN